MGQDFDQRPDPVSVQSRCFGKLIGVSAPLDDQGRVDQVNGMPAGDPQPHVIIFAGRQGFVKQADLIEEFPAHHHRGRAHQTQGKAGLENHPGRLLVPLFGVDPHTVSDPDLFGLADQRVRMPGEEFHLADPFAGQPEIVGIQKGDQVPCGCLNARVPGRADPPVGLADDLDPVPISVENPRRVIRRSVVHHDQLIIGINLIQYRINGFPENPAPIVSRQDNADGCAVSLYHHFFGHPGAAMSIAIYNST